MKIICYDVIFDEVLPVVYDGFSEISEASVEFSSTLGIIAMVEWGPDE